MLFSLLVLVACNSGKEEDPAEHACEHIAEGGTAVSAGADIASAPEIILGEEAYEVTLVSGAAGFLNVAIDGDTPALLFLDTADVAMNLYQDGTEVGLPEGAPNEFCAEDIPEHFDLDFHTAGTWSLELGPAAVESVWLMLVEATGHGHEDE